MVVVVGSVHSQKPSLWKGFSLRDTYCNSIHAKPLTQTTTEPVKLKLDGLFFFFSHKIHKIFKLQKTRYSQVDITQVCWYPHSQLIISLRGTQHFYAFSPPSLCWSRSLNQHPAAKQPSRSWSNHRDPRAKPKPQWDSKVGWSLHIPATIAKKKRPSWWLRLIENHIKFIGNLIKPCAESQKILPRVSFHPHLNPFENTSD